MRLCVFISLVYNAPFIAQNETRKYLINKEKAPLNIKALSLFIKNGLLLVRPVHLSSLTNKGLYHQS